MDAPPRPFRRPAAAPRVDRVARPRALRARRAAALAALCALVAAGCADQAPSSTPSASPAAGTPTANVAPVAAVPAGLVPVSVTVPAGLGAAPFDTAKQALVPPGWTMSVWARMPSPRLEAWTPDRTLLVSRPDLGDVQRLVPDGRGGTTASTLISGLTQPHGMAFAGSTLYIAESDRVAAYDYANGALTNPRPVVENLPDSKSPDLRGAYAHALKSVAVGPDGAVYISVGSTSNVSPQDRDATPERASILRVPPGGGAPQTYTRGVRNGTGLAVAPDGQVWTAVNNRDQIAYPFAQPYDGAAGSSFGQVIPAYVTNHPSEELARLTPGRDLGWPFCNPDPDPGETAPGPLPASVASPAFTRDAQFNADGSKLDCAALPRIEQAFGAHSAPLGLSFVSPGPTGLPGGFASGALVGLHGSWDAQPPRAPEVSFFPYVNGQMGAQQTLIGGFQGTDGSRWGRPVAAVLGPDGAVYVSDDVANAIYRLAPPGR